jgi:hypothetical protein
MWSARQRLGLARHWRSSYQALRGYASGSCSLAMRSVLKETICEGRLSQQKPSQCLNKVLCNLQMLEAPAGRDKIAMLIISPTRELAAQIAEEAKQLTKHQNLGVQVESAQQNFQRRLCTCPTNFDHIFAHSFCHTMCTPRNTFQERSKTCIAPGMAGNVWRHKYEP